MLSPSCSMHHKGRSFSLQILRCFKQEAAMEDVSLSVIPSKLFRQRMHDQQTCQVRCSRDE